MSRNNYTITMHTFLDEMAYCFPQHVPIQDYKKSFQCDTSAAQIVDTLHPFAEEITLSKTSVYEDNRMHIGSGLDIHDLWTMATTEQQRKSIHSYVHALFIMASMITTLSEHVLDTIDSMVQSYLSGNASLETLMDTETSFFDEEKMTDLCKLMLPTMEMDSLLIPKKMSP